MTANTILIGMGVGLFALLALWYGASVPLAASWTDRVSNGLHAAMAACMAAMPVVTLPSVQVAAFSAGVFFYVGLGAFGLDIHHDPLRAGAQHSALGSKAGLAYHALMMAAMAWMGLAMTPAAPSMTMSGMTMSEMSTSGMSASGMHQSDGVPMTMTGSLPWAHAVSVGLGVLFAVAAVVLLLGFIRRAASATLRPRALGDDLAATLMAGGMAFAFLLPMT